MHFVGYFQFAGRAVRALVGFNSPGFPQHSRRLSVQTYELTVRPQWSKLSLTQRRGERRDAES